MRKKIIFFTCEPGGAEVLSSVIKFLSEDYNVSVAAYGYAEERFKREKIKFDSSDHIFKDDLSLIEKYNPDLIISSATSYPPKDMSEKYLWHNARKAGVPTIAFLDQWQNYVFRFSGISEDEKMKYQPDFINCINELGKMEMTALGFDPSKLCCLGHPYLSSLKEKYAVLNADEIKKKLNLSNRPVFLLVSEPLLEYYGDSRGYDQYSVMEYFLSNMRKLEKPVDILVRPHPKDDIEKFMRFKSEAGQHKLTFIKPEVTQMESIKAADYVYGMSSIMLIESFILGKKVCSLQPGLKGEDPLVISRLGIVDSIKEAVNFDPMNVREAEAKKFDYNFKKDKLEELIQNILFKREELQK